MYLSVANQRRAVAVELVVSEHVEVPDGSTARCITVISAPYLSCLKSKTVVFTGELGRHGVPATSADTLKSSAYILVGHSKSEYWILLSSKFAVMLTFHGNAKTVSS